MTPSPFVDQLQEQLEAGIPVEAQRQRRNRLFTGVGVGALLIGLVVALFLGGPEPTDQIQAGPGDLPPTARAVTPSADETPQPAPTVEVLANPGDLAKVPVIGADPGSAATPVSLDHFWVNVWTGDQLLLYGTQREAGVLLGRAFSPTDQIWSELPAAPGGDLLEPVGVWTGTEMIVCCGEQGNRLAHAWNPATGTWRSLTPPPLGDEEGLWVSEARWVRGRMLVFLTGFRQAGQVWGYTPELDQWFQYDTPEGAVDNNVSLAAIDSRLVVWPRPPQRTTHTGWLFDTESGEWTQLPSPPAEAWPAIAEVAWAGEEIMLVGGLPGATMGASERFVGAALNLQTMQWRTLPDVFPEPRGCECNLGSHSMVWTGSRLVVSIGALVSGIDPLDGGVFAYDPATDTWSTTRISSGAYRQPTVLMGDQLALINGAAITVVDTADFTQAEPLLEAPAPLLVPDLVEHRVREVPLTLVGTDGVGALTVVDLEYGLRADYGAEDHQLGRGSFGGMVIGPDGDLYLWRRTLPGRTDVYRYNGGSSPWETERLVSGELSVAPETVNVGNAQEPVIVPLDGNRAWVVDSSPTGGRSIQLVNTITGVTLQEVWAPGAWRFNTLSSAFPEVDGALVYSQSLGGSETGVLLTPNGETLTFSDDELVGVAGAKVLMQECVQGVCSRESFAMGRGGVTESAMFNEDPEYRYLPMGGPMWPSTAPPLDTGSPGGNYVLVRRVASDRDETSGDYSWTDIALVDLRDGAVTPLITSAAAPNVNVGTWSRDGRYVVLVANETDLVVVDLQTGVVRREADIIPDGFGILAAG